MVHEACELLAKELGTNFKVEWLTSNRDIVVTILVWNYEDEKIDLAFIIEAFQFSTGRFRLNKVVPMNSIVKSWRMRTIEKIFDGELRF